ncbi:type II and III secretion system protein family protein [Psychrobacter sp. K31L]|uniref:type II and III secretion system protein family protein n=1 Tax=Psychrobacter sp. K31L TaxID=2820758 RepID=UPI001B34056A|nr:pilus assembly protein N-terminal domain-containing protein [Psychrobacter sp. K31L]MBP3946758.1 pilus assembly protein N-terminal domain-containing protein [Psychrobacter sp. K31L]
MFKRSLCLILISASTYAAANINNGVMTLYVGQSEFVKDSSITNVSVGSDEIVNALPIDKKGILLTGVKNGDTTIKVWRNNSVQSINTHIYPANLPRMLNEIQFFLMKYPGLEANIVGDTIIVEGSNLSDDDKGKVDSFLAQYKYITNLTSPNSQAADKNDTRMIYFDVKIVEVTRSASQNLGIQWSSQVNGPRVGVIGEFKKSNAFKSPDVSDLGFDNIPVGSAIRPFQTYAGLISSITSSINLMESEGVANLIAHPVLSCRNGGNAEFLSGGEVPYSSSGPTGTPSVDFKEYGIKLNVSPIIQSDGSILANIQSEISEIDPAVQIDNVPGLLTRKTTTDFSLQNGETLVLSGLNYNRNSDTSSKVPGLHKAPLIGRFFKNNSEVNSQTELLFIVTPFIYSEKDDPSKNLAAKANEVVDTINANNKILPKDFFNSDSNRIYFQEGIK